MKDKIDIEALKTKLKSRFNYEIKENETELIKCISDINYQYCFPEDMCESRTDWEELRNRLLTAHLAIIELISII